ncbi:thioredoxin family protein [Nitrosopumilus sp.]|uniref:thioredoxin family protein n=1 Tax=Nitrosopumilus sp. TaxID=2024843 RepID=UPI00260EE41A|nr:thioredoxin family protein [Nitrosopumilus sp.]
MKIQLITSEGCVGCEKIEKMLDEFRIDYELVDVAKNPRILEKFPVFMAPALIKNDEIVFTGVPKREEFLKKLGIDSNLK